MRVWDQQKMNDLVSHKAKLETKFGELCDSLHQQHGTDGWQADDAKMQQYTTDQMAHAQIQREIDHVNGEIAALENFRPETVREKQDAPFSRFLRRGHNGLEDGEIKAQSEIDMGDEIEVGPGYERYVLTPEDGLGAALPQHANDDDGEATRSDNSSGSVLNPLATRASVIDALKFFGGISRMAFNFSTGEGNEYRLPAHDDTSQKGELLSNQNDEVSQDASGKMANFEFAAFGAETMSSKPIYITREMIQDSIIDISAFANARVVRRMGRGWDERLTKGGSRSAGASDSAVAIPGHASSTGVRNVARLSGFHFASKATPTFDEMVDLEYGMDRAYRMGMEFGEGGLADQEGRIGWLISDDAEKVLRKLKDSDDRPIWLPQVIGSLGIANRMPTISGFPYEVSGSLDDFGTDKNIPILFGNFGYYGIRTVAAIEVFRFQDSRTMQRNSIEILGFSRRFGRPMVAGDKGANPGGNTGGARVYLGIPQIVAGMAGKANGEA